MRFLSVQQTFLFRVRIGRVDEISESADERHEAEEAQEAGDGSIVIPHGRRAFGKEVDDKEQWGHPEADPGQQNDLPEDDKAQHDVHADSVAEQPCDRVDRQRKIPHQRNEHAHRDRPAELANGKVHPVQNPIIVNGQSDDDHDPGKQAQKIAFPKIPQAFQRAGDDLRFGADVSACRDHFVSEFPVHDDARNERERDQDQNRRQNHNGSDAEDEQHRDRGPDQHRDRRPDVFENLKHMIRSGRGFCRRFRRGFFRIHCFVRFHLFGHRSGPFMVLLWRGRGFIALLYHIL